MSVEWRKAVSFSLFFHLFLGVAILLSSWPQKAKPPQVIKLRLKSVPLSEAPKGKGIKSQRHSPVPLPSRPKPLRPKVAPKPPSAKKVQVKKRPPAPKRQKVAKKAASSKAKKGPRAPSARKASKKKLAKRSTKKPSPARGKAQARGEETLLKKRLAALRAKAEEKALAQRLAALKAKRQGEGGAGGGLSLGGNTLSHELLLKLTAHLKSFWAVPEILKDKLYLRAEVEIELAPDGHLLHWRFLRRSGEPLFDEAVSKCLKQADPLPSPGKFLRLPVVFKIED